MKFHLLAFFMLGTQCLLLWRSTFSNWQGAVYWLLCLQALGWLLWWGMAQLLAHERRLPRCWWLSCSVAWLMSLHAMPLLDDDAWRFLWDGWAVLAGHNPYLTVPADALGDQRLPAEMALVLSRTAYPDVPTVYGPVLQLLFALSAGFASGQLWALRLVMACFLPLLLWAVARRLGEAERWRVALVAMAPPLWMECGLNAHPDLPAIACMTSALAVGKSHPRLSALLAALSFAMRVHAALLLPFLLWAWPWRAKAMFGFTLMCLYLPVLWSGCSAEWAGMLEFSAVWEFNSSLSALLGRPAALATAACLWAVAWVCWWKDGASLHRVPGAFCFAILFIASPVFNPWYALWLLPFLCQPGSQWRWAWLGLPALSYLTCGNLGTDLMNPFAHPAWLRPVEFSLLAVASTLSMKAWARSHSA